MDVTLVADRFDEQAFFRMAHDESRSAKAALQDTGARVQAKAGFLFFGSVTGVAIFSQDGTYVSFEEFALFSGGQFGVERRAVQAPKPNKQDEECW